MQSKSLCEVNTGALVPLMDLKQNGHFEPEMGFIRYFPRSILLADQVLLDPASTDGLPQTEVCLFQQ